MVKGSFKPILEHCLVTLSESISISWWTIWLNLVFEIFTKFLLKIRTFTLLRWWRGRRWRRGWGRRRWWWWCTFIPSAGIDLRFYPHMSQDLANSFFNFWLQIAIACHNPTNLSNLTLWNEITNFPHWSQEGWWYL